MDLTAVGACGAAVIAAGAAVLTQRNAARTTAKTAAGASRTDMEKDAYVRAETFLNNTIDEQNEQIDALRKTLATEKQERTEEVAALRRRLTENERETTSLRLELDTAKRTIRVLRGGGE